MVRSSSAAPLQERPRVRSSGRDPDLVDGRVPWSPGHGAVAALTSRRYSTIFRPALDSHGLVRLMAELLSRAVARWSSGRPASMSRTRALGHAEPCAIMSRPAHADVIGQRTVPRSAWKALSDLLVEQVDLTAILLAAHLRTYHVTSPDLLACGFGDVLAPTQLARSSGGGAVMTHPPAVSPRAGVRRAKDTRIGVGAGPAGQRALTA